ncbi:MAG: polyprenyl synthetase family protein [Opitutaceae bacterium]|nr:polyprenyl synthetase family protein [Opitutaceae bacterium]
MIPASTSGGDSPRAQLLARAHQAYVTGIAVNAREPHLAGVLRDTLATPGNLTRLQLGLIAGAALDLPAAATRPLASALEYFHTASLLLDDLPCMDDAHLRRGRPCPHVVHGEGATILGALGFINRGYRLVWDALAAVPEAHRAATAAHVERCLGTAGVLDGQSLDLHFTATDRTPRTVARIALGKTVSLLRLSLVTPALLAGAGARERLLIDRVSVAWGLAYQIADDFGDLGSGAVTGKTAGRDAGRGRPNFVIAAGRDAASARLRRLLGLLDSSFRSLVELRPGWRTLGPLIDRFGVAASAHLHDPLPASRCA